MSRSIYIHANYFTKLKSYQLVYLLVTVL